MKGRLTDVETVRKGGRVCRMLGYFYLQLAENSVEYIWKLSWKVNPELLVAGCFSACNRQTYSVQSSRTIKSFPLVRHKKTHMTMISRALEKWEETRDNCEGMTIIVSFRGRCPQVKVITEDHYPPLSVGVRVCVLQRPAFQTGPSSRLQRCGWHPNVTHKRQKCGSTEGVSAPFRHFAINLTDGMGCLRPWQWGVQWLQRPSVICSNITGWEKVTVSQTPALLRGRARR